LFETFDTATILLRKIFAIQRAFCLLYLQARNDQSEQENSQKFEKTSTRSGDGIMWKMIRKILA